LDGLELSRILDTNAHWLDRPFEEDEVFGVVNGFNGDKAPGSDGFPMAFFQICWSVLKEDIMAVFRSFHVEGQFEKSLKQRFWPLFLGKWML
jgi:hypothetical protein